MKKVIIFCDGSCLNNPGNGGWAYILRFNEHEKMDSGAQANTTNNQMELKAAINALKALKEACEVQLFTDSSYVANGINSWLEKWQKNGFKGSDKKPIKNQDLWFELATLLKIHKVSAFWLKGHAGHEENELCDKMAREKAEQLKKGKL